MPILQEAVNKMKKQIGIWSTRELTTLWHREKVISTYITSKLWYRAAILPLPQGKKDYIESKIGNFLWLGTLERVRKGTSNLTTKRGGLGLPRVSLRGSSILRAQVCRILGGSTGQQMWQLLAYWAGDVTYKMPWLVTVSNLLVVPEYFQTLNLLLLELSDSMDELSPVDASNLSAKKIYGILEDSDFLPVPRVQEFEEAKVFKGSLVPGGWSRVWKRASHKVHSVLAKM